MPELPDVEVFRRQLDRTARGKRVRHVSAPKSRVLQVPPSTLRSHLEGKRLGAARRHGKLLFVELDGGDENLVLHFGMTGFPAYYRRDADKPEHTRVELELDDGHRLAYDDQRLFGEVSLARDPDELIRERGLGPDALGLSRRQLEQRLGDRRGAIKPALMDQKRIAGLGNIYVDEILFHARLHPRTKVEELKARDWDRLHRAMGHVLRRAIEAGADPERMPRTWLLPHRGQGEHCPRCGTRLARVRIQNRSSWVCPKCQPA